MLTVAIPKRNKLQNIIVLTPKDGFLGLIEDYARKQGKRGIRLDCQLGNEPLNRFYERNGYVTVGEPFTAGGYTGIRKVLEF